MRMIYHIGRYSMFLVKVFSKPEKHRMFLLNVIKELNKLGVDSLGIVTIISLFMGAVITLQTAYNIDMPIVPRYTIGFAARDSILLELSSTIVCLILAGKVGSNIASEIGTMRVTEQIEALEVMGVNSASFLVLPKITASILIFPLLVILGMVVGITGGWLAGFISGEVPSSDYIYGLQYGFKPFYIVYGIVKTIVFAFIISSISGYWGYYASGGALEVGKASTTAVVVSSIQVLLFNLLLTQLLLA